MLIIRNIILSVTVAVLVSNSAVHAKLPDVENRDNLIIFKTFEDVQFLVEVLTSVMENNIANANMPPESDKISDEEIYKTYMNAPEVLGLFEEVFQFKSLRMLLNERQKLLYKKFSDPTTPRDFYDKIMEDSAADPARHYVDDPVFQSFLNHYAEFGVGYSFFRVYADGIKEYKSYDELLATRPQIATTPPVTLASAASRVLQLGSTCCTSNKFQTGSSTSGNRRIDWYVAHSSWPGVANPWIKWANARTRNYRYIKILWWGFWIPVIRTTTSRVFGSVSGTTLINCLEVKVCKNQFNFNPNNNSVTLTWFSVNHIMFVNAFTFTNWVKGFHNAPPVPAYTSTLWF
jgi:hypothetical protein